MAATTATGNMKVNMNQEKIKTYKKNLGRLLKANQLPKMELNGKYRKSYKRLKCEVKEQTTEIIKIICFDGFQYKEGIYEDINNILKENTVHKILDNVYSICWYPDYDRVESTALELREYVIKRLGEIGWHYTEFMI